MNVSEKLGNGTAPDIFDNIFAEVVEAECHGTTGSQLGSTDAQRRVYRVEKSTEDDALPEC